MKHILIHSTHAFYSRHTQGFYGQNRYRWHGTLDHNGNESMGGIGREHCATIGYVMIDFCVILPLKYPSVRAHWNMRCTIKDVSCPIVIVIVIRIHRVYSIRVPFIVWKPVNQIFKVRNNSAAMIGMDFYSCHTIKCGARGHVVTIISVLCHGMKPTKCQHYQLGTCPMWTNKLRFDWETILMELYFVFVFDFHALRVGTTTFDHFIRVAHGKVSNRLAVKHSGLSVDQHRIAFHISRQP